MHLLPWLVSAACFAYLYTRLERAAGSERSVAAYLYDAFAAVDWGRWVVLMFVYSVFYLLVDTAVLWRVVNWFNARVRFAELLPVRASAYILSILNEQVGKGAIALYLNRKYGVPAWESGSSMLFIMVCELFYLIFWATVGVLLFGGTLPAELAVFRAVPWVAAAAGVVGAFGIWAFRSSRFEGAAWRQRPLLRAFREARPWQYAAVMLLRSPSLLAAVAVYAVAANLFGVRIGFGEMLSYLPLVIFGTLVPGPFRAVAVTMWPTLFPEHAAAMTIFGFVQHNCFMLFNAAIGLLFLRQTNRELFEATEAARAA
ncbi:MAG TPA: hypothetical protein VHQ66_15155 [Myxococcota bacterium]|nr:hypothetical protein [Myxococcota bacterium]